MQYGSKVSGSRKPVTSTLALSNPGEVYELEVYTEEPFVNDEEIIDQVFALEQEFPDLQVQYVETCDCKQKIVLQVTDVGPGQVSLAGLVSLIPHIFIAVGIIVVAIMLWNVVTTSPWLVWLLALSGGFVIFYYFVGRYFKLPEKVYERKPREERERERVERERRDLDKERVGLSKEIASLDKEIGRLTTAKTRLENRINLLKKKKPPKYKEEIEKHEAEIGNIKDKLDDIEDTKKGAQEQFEEVLRRYRALRA